LRLQALETESLVKGPQPEAAGQVERPFFRLQQALNDACCHPLPAPIRFYGDGGQLTGSIPMLLNLPAADQRILIIHRDHEVRPLQPHWVDMHLVN
jgi:hypothetical protein